MNAENLLTVRNAILADAEHYDQRKWTTPMRDSFMRRGICGCLRGLERCSAHGIYVRLL